jgi:FkbM family methyltransferase
MGYVRGDHEFWIARLLTEWLRPGDMFIDVGAHIGYFSLCAARLVGAEGKVIACEPDPENYSRLRSNIERSPYSQIVQTHKAAVGSRAGNGTFRRGTAIHARVGGFLTDHATDEGEHLRVPLLRLDDLCPKDMPRTIKIDVEGGEVEVLQGASNIMHRQRTRWIIELHNENARATVLRSLEKAGYHFHISRPSHPVYEDYHQEYVVAEPPELSK